MQFFEYTPDWSAIQRRTKMKLDSDASSSQKIKLKNTEFKTKDSTTQKKKTELCTQCKKSKHAPSQCPERAVKVEEEVPAVKLYSIDLVLTPTTVRITNLPNTTQRETIRNMLSSNNILYDSINMVYENRETKEEYKGITYVELPSKNEGEKCVKLFDRIKIGVQIVSAEAIEKKERM